MRWSPVKIVVSMAAYAAVLVGTWLWAIAADSTNLWFACAWPSAIAASVLVVRALKKCEEEEHHEARTNPGQGSSIWPDSP